jgi:outer membrane biogenesis lipoprotein LolB
MKNFAIPAVLLALACLSSITCAPISTTNSSHVQWNKRGTSFLIKLFNLLVATGGDLSQLVGASQVVGVYATVKSKCEDIS